MDVSFLPDSVIWVGIIVMSLLVGSFLNVVIHRLPLMMQPACHPDKNKPAPKRFNLAVPGSHCPHCHASVARRHNLPLLGYLWLGGRCAVCHRPISRQYPLVELGAVLLAVLTCLRFGFTGWSACMTGVAWALLTLAVIDLRTFLLPDVITLPLLWAGLLASVFDLALHAPTPAAAILGAALGYSVLWLLSQGFHLATGRVGMGQGDLKLVAALGAWLGWPSLLMTLFSACLICLIFTGLAMATGRTRRHARVPFGPWLAVAGWLNLVAGDTILGAYLTLSGLR